jgi:hypothetical protein
MAEGGVASVTHAPLDGDDDDIEGLADLDTGDDLDVADDLAKKAS